MQSVRSRPDEVPNLELMMSVKWAKGAVMDWLSRFSCNGVPCVIYGDYIACFKLNAKRSAGRDGTFFCRLLKGSNERIRNLKTLSQLQDYPLLKASFTMIWRRQEMYPEWVPVFVMAWSIGTSRAPSVWGTDLLGVAETEDVSLKVTDQWSRVALSKGPNWMGSSPFFTSDYGARSSFWNAILILNLRQRALPNDFIINNNSAYKCRIVICAASEMLCIFWYIN